MNDPRAATRSATSIYGKWSRILVFIIIYLLDRAKRRHLMVLIELMIVIVFYSFWVIHIRILIPIEAFPSNLSWPGLPSWAVALAVLYGGIINSVTHESFFDVAGFLRENMMK